MTATVDKILALASLGSFLFPKKRRQVSVALISLADILGKVSAARLVVAKLDDATKSGGSTPVTLTASEVDLLMEIIRAARRAIIYSGSRDDA